MQNCWDIKKCERQPGGAKIDELGLCPASIDASADGLNNGKNGGRICWALTGTFCGGKVQGTSAQKMNSCLACEFYLQVKREEGSAFELMPLVRSK